MTVTWLIFFVLPCEHAEERVDDLSSERDAHLDSQRLEQRQEEGQHLVRHIWAEEEVVSGLFMTIMQSPFARRPNYRSKRVGPGCWMNTGKRLRDTWTDS